MLRIFTLVVGLVILTVDPVESETYFVAPLGTTLPEPSDGSENLPFLSIPGAFASGKVKGGDTLLLKDGAYGSVTIKTNAAFDAPVTIMSKNGKSAQFDNILFALNTRNLVLRNVSVWPRDPATGLNYLVRAYDSTSDITLDGLDVRSEEGAASYVEWDADRWNARKFSGILLQGPRGQVLNSRLTGIYHGIMVANDSKVVKNIIVGFNGDGMRAASDSLVQGNRVIDCVKTDGNHDDGFQALSTTNLTIDSNIIIEWTGDQGHPLRCPLQGIGLFDGMYKNTTIKNNLVSVTAYHGITILGAAGAAITNNTVVNSRGLTGTSPYISVRPHKNGTVSTDVLVANNVAMSLNGAASLENNVVFVNNSVIGAPALKFEDPFAFDYRPKASSGYIDTGDAEHAPAKDLLGNPRPSGSAPDQGAYEIQVGGTVAPPSVVEPVKEPAPVLKPEPGEKPVPVVKPDPVTSPGTVVTGPKRVKPPRKSTATKGAVTFDSTRNGAKRIVLTKKSGSGS